MAELFAPGLFSVDVRVARTFTLNPQRSGRVRTTPEESGGGSASSTSAPSAGPSNQRTFTGFGDGLNAPDGSSKVRNYKLTVSVSGRNILNHLNPGPIVGNITSLLFAQSNQIGGGVGAFGGNSNNRRLEFQLRLEF